LTERIPLQRAPGVPLTGFPNTAINDSGNTPYNDEVAVDLKNVVQPLDPFGGDFEGRHRLKRQNLLDGRRVSTRDLSLR
jgi:hypothetical protein